MNKVLVTGASGYLGSNFINAFENKYEFLQFSLQKESIKNIDFQDINIILHCAALVHQKRKYSYEKYHKINVDYPVKLAKRAKAKGVKQFIFISSIAIYGGKVQKLNENTTCNPVTHYGKSKLEAEKQLLELNDDSFIVSIVRAPMIYGKNAPGNIDNLIKLVKKVPIIPLGNINNRRSFIFIQNLCHLVNEIIRFPVKLGMTDVLSSSGLTSGSSCEETPNQVGNNGIYLAADDEPLSTTRLIELIAKSLNKKVYLIKIPFFESLLKFVKPSFHKRLYGSLEVDNALTKEKLNLKNPYSVEEGIELMLND